MTPDPIPDANTPNPDEAYEAARTEARDANLAARVAYEVVVAKAWKAYEADPTPRAGDAYLVAEAKAWKAYRAAVTAAAWDAEVEL